MAEELAMFDSVAIGEGITFSGLTPNQERPGIETKIQVKNGEKIRWVLVRVVFNWKITAAILTALGKGEPNPLNTLADFAFSLRVTGVLRDDGRGGLVSPPRFSLYPTDKKPTAKLVTVQVEYSPGSRFKIINQGKGEYSYILCVTDTITREGSSGIALIVAVVNNLWPLIVKTPDGTFTVVNMDGIHSGIQTEEEALSYLPSVVAEPEPEPEVVAAAEPEAAPSEPLLPDDLEVDDSAVLAALDTDPSAPSTTKDDDLRPGEPAVLSVFESAAATDELEDKEPKPAAKKWKKAGKNPSPVKTKKVQEVHSRGNGKLGTGSRSQQENDAVNASLNSV